MVVSWCVPAAVACACSPRPGRVPSSPACVSGTAVWEPSVTWERRAGRQRPGAAAAGDGPSGGGEVRGWQRVPLPPGGGPRWGNEAPGAPSDSVAVTGSEGSGVSRACAVGRFRAASPSYAFTTLCSCVTVQTPSPQTPSICRVTVAAHARLGYEPHGAARGGFEGIGPLRGCVFRPACV